MKPCLVNTHPIFKYIHTAYAYRYKFVTRWNRPVIESLFTTFNRAFPSLVGKLVALHLVTPSRITELNLAYRRKRRTTDCLSFRNALDDEVLGEIVLCPDVALRRLQGTKKCGMSEGQASLHLTKLLIHSYLHLTGYDHHTLSEFKAMRKQEVRLLRLVGPKRPILNT